MNRLTCSILLLFLCAPLPWQAGTQDQDNLGTLSAYYNSGLIKSTTDDRGKVTNYI